MKTFHCWITSYSLSYKDSIIVELIKAGYMVGAASEDGIVTCNNCPNDNVCIMTLHLYKINSDKELSLLEIYKEIISILVKNSFYYYSVVITPSVECIWGGSFLPKIEMPVEVDLSEIEKGFN